MKAFPFPRGMEGDRQGVETKRRALEESSMPAVIAMTRGWTRTRAGDAITRSIVVLDSVRPERQRAPIP